MSIERREAGEWLAAARSVFVLTGAGVSAESGIPTFRGKDGYWKDHDPMELASPEGFERDPALVWEWYVHRIKLVRSATPNAAHRAVVAIEKRTPEFLLVTQNVDGLHARAGSRRLVEVHGSILRARCMETGRSYRIDELDLNPPFPVKTPEGRLARPDVVWFGETVRSETFARVEEFLELQQPELCLICGTTGVLPYIKRWALIAKQRGARLVEINPEPSPLSRICDAVLAGPAGEELPALL